MINSVLKYIWQFILLLLIQLLLMDNIQFSGYINPYIYVLIILILPFETPSWLLLLIAFVSGLTVDLFEGTLGLHTSSLLIAAFVRPYVLRVISPREEYEKGALPGIRSYGFRWFLIYVTIMVFIHHFFMFNIETFRISLFFNSFLRIILSSVFSIIFILIIESLIIRE
jgi:rod shape-determining protein MreD